MDCKRIVSVCIFLGKEQVYDVKIELVTLLLENLTSTAAIFSIISYSVTG